MTLKNENCYKDLKPGCCVTSRKLISSYYNSLMHKCFYCMIRLDWNMSLHLQLKLWKQVERITWKNRPFLQHLAPGRWDFQHLLSAVHFGWMPQRLQRRRPKLLSGQHFPVALRRDCCQSVFSCFQTWKIYTMFIQYISERKTGNLSYLKPCVGKK